MAALEERSPATRSLGRALFTLACALALAAGVELALFPGSGAGPLWILDLFAVAGLVYAAAGLVAWWRRPSNLMGAIMIAGGLVWLTVALANVSQPTLIAVATVLATAPLAIPVHLLLAFPSGRLRARSARLLAAAGYVNVIVLQVPLYLFAPGPSGLAVANRPDLARAAATGQKIVGALIMLAVAVVLAGRLRRARVAQRRVLVPLYAYGIIAVLFVPIGPDVLAPLGHITPVTIAASQVIVLAGVPVAFAVGMLRGGFARMSELQELRAWLGAADPGHLPVERATARALGDDSARLAFWIAERTGYVDAAGRPTTLPIRGSGRAAAEVELAGRRIGAIVYDETLIGDPGVVRAAGRVVALAVDHHRLTAELLASREALRASRVRLVEAADRERRRIAQDLHDGLQSTLVLLAIEAQRAGMETLRSRIDAAAVELRELVQGVMPAPLVERGLRAAAEDLVGRMPVPVKLDADLPAAVPEPVAVTAYFVFAEGLANAVKHARASRLEVRLCGAAGSLTVEVRDDGRGGAAPGDGFGLRGLADRVDTLGGRLTIDSPPGRGTRLCAELPCP